MIFDRCEWVVVICCVFFFCCFFFFQAEDGIRDLVRSRGLGDVYKRQRKHLVFFHAAGGYTRLNHSTSVERFLFHARYNYEIAPWVWLEAFGQVEHLSLIHI